MSDMPQSAFELAKMLDDASGKKSDEFTAGANAMRLMLSAMMAQEAPNFRGVDGETAVAKLALSFAATKF